MQVRVAHSGNVEGCLAQLRSGGESLYRMVVYFASARHDQGAVNSKLRGAFPGAIVIGCSTAGELSSGRMTDGEIVVMAIPADLAGRAAAVAIEDLNAPDAVATALRELGVKMGRPVATLDLATHAGLILVDGMSMSEEALMERLGDLVDLPFVGGSAGDDLAFRETAVSCDGKVYAHGAVLAVLELPHGYRVVKTQSFAPTGKRLTATAVDEAARTVFEFDGQPAAKAYADALGVSVAGLSGEFMRHPLGLMANGEPFVRSPQHLAGGGAVVFYCNVRQGAELEILESGDIVADTQRALQSDAAGLAAVAGILNFNCILRTLELKARDRCSDYGHLFDEIPTAGFSTYGEEYIGHINQTATMLVMGGPAEQRI